MDGNDTIASMGDLANSISGDPNTVPTFPDATPSPSVTVPFMTRTDAQGGDKGKLVDLPDLSQVQNSLYVNVQVLGFGTTNDAAQAMASQNLSTLPTLSGQDPAREANSKKDGGVGNPNTHAALVDTGSWATVLSKSYVEQATGMTDAQLAGYPDGQFSYSSSGNPEVGKWVPITIGFPDATNPDGSMVTATVTALVTTDAGSHAMLGVGINDAFAMATQGHQMTPDDNAFLNTSSMQAGTMARSFAIDSDGIHLGENAADERAAGGWTLQKLRKSTLGASPSQHIQDWRFPETTITVDGKAHRHVSTMIDTGVPEMILETKGDHGSQGQSHDVSVSMGGSGHHPGNTSWAFTTTQQSTDAGAPSLDASQPTAPNGFKFHGENSSGSWTDVAGHNVNASYANTGLNPLRSNDYLFDAGAGVFGLHHRSD